MQMLKHYSNEKLADELENSIIQLTKAANGMIRGESTWNKRVFALTNELKKRLKLANESKKCWW